MAIVVVVIDVPSEGIGQLNAEIQNSGNPHEAVINLRNMMDAAMGGLKGASFQVTTRDTAPSITTSGTGSLQVTYNLK